MLLTPKVTLQMMHSTGISLLKRLLILEMAFPIDEEQHNLKFKFPTCIQNIIRHLGEDSSSQSLD